ncbi:MAG TPA: hypothetical protein VLN08_16090, partial [Vicinamibacterales bacterium]|nr:hypothetical protein [Vicinamibacterales bacterium]
QIPAAAAHAEQALAIAAELAAADPENVDWRRELGRSHYRAGPIADAGGRRADAQSHLQQALAILARAADLDPRTPARQRDLAEVHAARAQHDLLEGDVPRAVAAAAAVQEIADRLITKSADDGQAVRLRGVALALQGRAWALAGDGAKARVAWARAASTLEAPARASRDYNLLDPWALTLIGLGRLDDAKEVVKVLGATGYRHPLFVEAITRGGLGLPPSPPAVIGVPRR